jgi:UPF0716 family protein affecting phage T7 exclusion
MDDPALCVAVSDQGRIRATVRRVQDWSRRHIPPGLRLVAGLLLMIGGVFGFLPVVGFWMFPLGVAVAALDVMPIWRAITGAKKE